MNETTSMPQVYAVLAQSMDYYASLELVRIFGTKDGAEAYAEELRGQLEEPLWEGAEPEPTYALVRVSPYSVH